MAKRKRRSNASNGESAADSGDGGYSSSRRTKMNINSYEDVADSGDEFHINRDKVLLDDDPDTKRRRKYAAEGATIEDAEEEVLGLGSYSDEDDLLEQGYDDGDDNEDEAEADERRLFEEHYNAGGRTSKARNKVSTYSDDEDDETNAQGEEDEVEGWGESRADYYNADVIETEQDALDEEAEAQRIQQRQLKSLKDADYGFDEDDWLDDGSKESAAGSKAGANGAVVEVLLPIVLSDDMTSEQMLDVLHTGYPEFVPLSKELLELQPLHQSIAREARAAGNELFDTNPSSTVSTHDQVAVPILKYHALSAYLSSIAMYFAIFSTPSDISPAQASKGNASPLPLAPLELRRHGIMNSLVQCRDIWTSVKDLQDLSMIETPAKSSTLSSDPSESALQLRREWAETDDEPSGLLQTPTKQKAQSKTNAAAADLEKAQARRQERLRRTEEALAALSLPAHTANGRTQRNDRASYGTLDNDSDSDLGDEPALLPHEAAAKAQRKRSLRFYTSQLAQTAQRRQAAADRYGGGDDDIPHRERFRDRQARLNEVAERRGKRGRQADAAAALDGRDDDEQEEETNAQRETQQEGPGAQYEEWLARRSADHKARQRAAKRAKAEAYAAEHGSYLVDDAASEGAADGRRDIGWTIAQNKGLAPRRRNEKKNPRVKKRMKYDAKMKKLASMKPVFKGGEGRGGYGGEHTGIKTGVVRSTRL